MRPHGGINTQLPDMYTDGSQVNSDQVRTYSWVCRTCPPRNNNYVHGREHKKKISTVKNGWIKHLHDYHGQLFVLPPINEMEN
jgi:hypothetical protein